MCTLARSWKAVSAVVLLMVAVAVVVTGAQSNTQTRMSPEQSNAVQAQLALIDSNRGAFVDDMFAKWQPYLDQNVYDISAELRDIAMQAPAWQVYGASLVGDYATMSAILRGRVSAGAYINALSQPQQKVASGFGLEPKTVGSYTDNLVFTPIAPCRIVDTRGTGARAGALAAGTSRAFDLTTGGLSKGQGGVTSAATCPGLPSYSYYGWAVNITAVGYYATGGLKAWGYSGTEPNASIINYSAGVAPAIANSATMIGCDGCVDDVVIKAFSSPTHVIIDVVGYYGRAYATYGSQSVMSVVVGTPVVIPNGSWAFVYGGTCPAGTILTGGEVDHGAGDLAMGESKQDGSNLRWEYWMINNSGGSATVTAWSKCMDAPIVF